MKVRCIKIYNENTGEYQTKSPWLTVGKEYFVLEIEIYPGKDVLFRMVGDNTNNSPALYDSRQFELVGSKIPSTWIIEKLECGMLIQGPQAWQKPDFWESFYDGDPKAQEIYSNELQKIIDEES